MKEFLFGEDRERKRKEGFFLDEKQILLNHEEVQTEMSTINQYKEIKKTKIIKPD